jgi:hypothetical protein
MGAIRRGVAVLIGVVVLAVAGTAWADGGRPDVSATSYSDVTSSSAVVRAIVHPKGNNTTYLFEYGPTTAYGSQTAATPVVTQDSAQPVSTTVTGLQGFTTYHFRVVAMSEKGPTYGPDRYFTTLAAPTTDPGSSPGPDLTTPAGVKPDLGSSVLIAPAKGTLRVRRPGTPAFVPLELGSELPVGTEVDARAGTIALTGALPSGATQTGNFGGGRFKILQDKRGYIDLHLRGAYCSAASTARAVAAGSGGRRLWGRDHGGRFRTHGRNSHATVRGTRWLVADTCRGTLTRVTNGTVVVRDKVRNKRVVLGAGERYLAKPHR